MKKLLLLSLLFFPIHGFSQMADYKADSISQNTERAVLINDQGLKNAMKYNAKIRRNAIYYFYNNQLYVYDRFLNVPKSKPFPKMKITKIIKNPDSIAKFLKDKIEAIIIVE